MKRSATLATAILTSVLAFFSCTPAGEKTEKDYTRYVNTFIGAADNGHTFPGACCPFGMIQTSPVTGAVGWRYCCPFLRIARWATAGRLS